MSREMVEGSEASRIIEYLKKCPNATNKEIATVLDISDNNVKANLSRLKSLRKIWMTDEGWKTFTKTFTSDQINELREYKILVFTEIIDDLKEACLATAVNEEKYKLADKISQMFAEMRR